MDNRPQQQKSPVLWVTTRTNANLRNKTKAEDHAIRKHVQSYLHHGRRQTDDKGQNGTGCVRRKGNGQPINHHRRTQHARRSESASQSNCATPSISPCPSLSDGSSPEPSTLPSRAASPAASPTALGDSKMALIDGLMSMSLVPFSGNRDPFCSTTISLSPHTLELLEHSKRFHVSTAWSRRAGAIEDKVADWILQLNDAIAAPLLLQTLLASGAFAKSRLYAGEPNARSDFLSANQQAIALLRRSIMTDHHTKTIVLAIMQMVCLSYHAGHYKEAVAYQRGAHAILRDRPSKDWKPHEMVLVTDVWLSVDDMEAGPFAPQEFDSGPWKNQHLSHAVAVIPRTDVLPELTTIPTLSTSSLRDLFEAIDELSDVYDWVHVTRNSLERSKASLWLHTRSTATKRRLMNYLIFARRASKKPTDLLRESLVTAVCNAAHLYVVFAFVPKSDTASILRFGPLATYRQILRRTVVEAGLRKPSLETKRLMLWLLFLGIISESHLQQENTKPEDLELFKATYRAMAKDIGCRTCIEVKAIMQQYLYRPQIMDDLLYDLMRDCDQ